MGVGVGTSSSSSGRHMQLRSEHRGPTPRSSALTSERTDVPSEQTHFFRCSPLLVLVVLLLFAWDMAGSCLPHAFGTGEEGESVLGINARAPEGPGVVGYEYWWCHAGSSYSVHT